MNKLRLTDVKGVVSRVLGVCDSSSVVKDYVNEAQRRLIPKGKWLGTVQTIRLCVSTDIITWPRSVETIEAWALCDHPGTIRNKWFEYVGNGPGVLKDDEPWFRVLIDRGTSPVTSDMTAGTERRVRVKADVTESASARILVRGLDGNGEAIRTEDAGSWIDGEYINISTTATNSTKNFAKVTGVIKPTTNGPIRLYEYNATTATQVKQIAFYEADETQPIYRRSLLPGLTELSDCSDDSQAQNDLDCEKYVDIVAKLRHIDVVNDNDYLILQSLSAIKLMVQAIAKEERNLPDEAVIYEAKALKELQDELGSFEGDGAMPVMKTEGGDTWGPGVINVIGSNYYFR